MKEKKVDLYNHEKEYFALKGRLNEGNKLTVIKGVRRVGKTSLMKVVYCEQTAPKIWIDGRTNSKKGRLLMEWVISELIRQIDLKSQALQFLSSVSIGPVSLKHHTNEKTLSSLAQELTNMLNMQKKKALIFIDEAQLISDLAAPLAYLYDHFTCLQFVLAGSEVGVLEKVVGLEADTPLFGRLKEEILVERLSADSALEYLKSGFAQTGNEPMHHELADALENLDGLIGWLTYYGYLRRQKNHSQALDSVLIDARKIVKSEFDSFLNHKKGAKTRYNRIIRILSSGTKNWTDIKLGLEVEEKKNISSGRISEYLNTLVEYSFVIKSGEHYSLADPLMKSAI